MSAQPTTDELTANRKLVLDQLNERYQDARGLTRRLSDKTTIVFGVGISLLGLLLRIGSFTTFSSTFIVLGILSGIAMLVALYFTVAAIDIKPTFTPLHDTEFAEINKQLVQQNEEHTFELMAKTLMAATDAENELKRSTAANYQRTIFSCGVACLFGLATILCNVGQTKNSPAPEREKIEKVVEDYLESQKK